MEFCRAMPTLLLSVLIYLQPGIAQEPFLCDIVCFSEYFASIPNYDCELLTYVIQCYDGHREECEADDYSSSTIGTVRNEFEVAGCPPLVTEPEPTTKAMSTEHTTAESATRSTTIEPVMTEHATLAPFLGCTVEVPPVGISTPSLSMAETSPTFVNRECIHQDEDEELQHCSMFGFSSLRPFPDRLYRSHLETCNIPWPRFLLMHPTISIEVEGVVSGNDCDYTRLSKVNVTFYENSNCLRQTKSYVATDSLLPQAFTDNTVPNNSYSNLQLLVNSDGTAVSLLASWINTTVVIRKYADLLGVTVQVPRCVAEESGGLCMGCPAQGFFDTIEYNYRLIIESDSDCENENVDVVTNCFFGFSTTTRPEFYGIDNATYADVCIYSLWRSNSTGSEVLSFLGAVTDDANALPNVQNTATPTPPPII